MKVLVIDVGGTNVKLLATGYTKVRKFPSGRRLTPAHMVKTVLRETGDWNYTVITIGVPAPIVRGKVASAPKNLGAGWVGFDFKAAFRKPVRLINDAAMQALGSYEGGCMLYLGLGTGLGSALIFDNTLTPLELAHLPYKQGKTFEDYVGLRGLIRLGKKNWQKAVEDTVARLKDALVADYVVLGGGNAKELTQVPKGARLGKNKNAILGGYRLWQRST
jgi:predicted NBD/HSP70 family sugar kinase